MYEIYEERDFESRKTHQLSVNIYIYIYIRFSIQSQIQQRKIKYHIQNQLLIKNFQITSKYIYYRLN